MEGKILPNSLPHFVTGSNSRHKIPILKLYTLVDNQFQAVIVLKKA